MLDSPYKPTVASATRASLTANLKASGLAKQLSVNDFVLAFFRDRLSDSDCALCVPTNASTIIAEIGRSSEKEAYKPSCKLLTGICDKYAGTYSVAQEDQLAFVCHSEHSPCQHPHSYTAAVAGQKPDLVVTRKWMAKLYLSDLASWTKANAKRTGKNPPKPAVAWPVIMGSLVEGKGSSDSNGHFQAATYLGSLLLARPDLIGCLGLAIDPKSFRLVWCDVSGVFYTGPIKWSDPEAKTLLVQYIRQLHFPLVDCTIRQAPCDRSSDTLDFDVWTDKSYAAPPVWFVDDRSNDSDGKPKDIVYVVENILSVGPAWSRKNWVARASERLLRRDDPDSRQKLDPPIVIKDSFIRPERAAISSEGDILAHIHRNGPVPGVVTMESQYQVLHEDGTPVSNVQLPPELDGSLQAPTRVRYRLFLPAYDLDYIFTACSSVQECLEVVYDVLEMSRYLHEEHDITHRDISPFNVLINSRTPGPMPAVPSSAKYRPVFIRQLLSYQNPEPAPNTPSCILLDFDNAFWADRATGALRTATPGFAARALSLRRLVGAHRPKKLPEIPALTGMAKEAYLRLHGAERYEVASAFHAGAVMADKEDDSESDVDIAPSDSDEDHEENPFNSNAASPEDSNGEDFANTAVIPHAPRHDAESSYWLLVWSLIAALPRGALLKDDNTKMMSEVMEHFDSHRVGVVTVRDKRSGFFELDKFEWMAILHHGFRSMARFLMKLGKVVKPEYGFVESDLNAYHLHEAMQRVVFQEICRLKESGNPLPIEREHRRKVLPRSPADDGLAATAMRAHAASSARKAVSAVSQVAGAVETRQTRSGKRSRTVTGTTLQAPEASTSDTANAGRQKKQKTAKDAPVRGQ